MSVPAKYSDSPDEARKRIISILTEWRKVSEGWCKSTASAVQAMAEAKDRKIWEPKYTFKEFCVQACGFSEAWGYQLLNCSKAIGAIGKYLDGSSTLESKSGISLDILNSLTPSHTEPIKRLPVPKQASIIANATSKAGGKTPTPAQVREAAKEADTYEPTEPEGVSEPVVVRDETGVPIPPKPLEYWNRRQEVKDMMSAISKLKCQVEKSREAQDPLWLSVAQHLISELELCYSHAKDALPYSLCTLCNGWPETCKCEFCVGMGILPKHRYMGTDDRIRAIREKAHAKFLAA